MSELLKLKQWIIKQEPELVEKLINWTNINTFSENSEGLTQFSKILKPELEKLGGTIEEITLDTIKTIDKKGHEKQIKTGTLFRVKKRENAKKKVLLSIHYDTVFPPDCSFQKTEKITDNKLIGPGVIDAKGGLLILMTALKAFEKLNIKNLGWEVLISPDEEIGSPKSAPYLFDAAKHCQYGLVFEPNLPNNAYVSGRMGSANLKVISTGKAAHVGRAFHEGKSAITALSHFIEQFRKKAKNYKSIINFGVIEGGTASNVVADFAYIDINIRSKTKRGMNTSISCLQNAINTLNKKYNYKLSLAEKRIRNPKPFSKNTQKLFKEFEAIHKQNKLPFLYQETGGVCDGNILHDAGLACIDTLGAQGFGLHTHQETLFIESLVKKTCITLEFLFQINQLLE